MKTKTTYLQVAAAARREQCCVHCRLDAGHVPHQAEQTSELDTLKLIQTYRAVRAMVRPSSSKPDKLPRL